MAGSIDSQGDGDMGFQIAPMIDVVFVLVLYFMASVGLQVHEKELSVDLPSPPGQSVTMPHFIEISAQGLVEINGTVYGQTGDHELPALIAQLTVLKKHGSQDLFIIRPDLDVSHGRVVDVLNAASVAGIRKLTFS